jgi:hypothetical protein
MKVQSIVSLFIKTHSGKNGLRLELAACLAGEEFRLTKEFATTHHHTPIALVLILKLMLATLSRVLVVN